MNDWQIFAFGSFWFWAAILAELVLLFLFNYKQNGIGALWSVVIFLCSLQFLGDINIIQYVKQNPIIVVSFLLAYFAFGVVWAIFKWWLYCSDVYQSYIEDKERFFKRKGISLTEASDEDVKLWKEQTSIKVPQVVDHKSDIMRWVNMWVISLLWSLFNDMFRRIGVTIYRKIAGLLQSISDKRFAEFK